MATIQEIWDSENALLFNGIVYENGSAVEILLEGIAKGRSAKPGARTTIYELQKQGCQKVGIDVLASARQLDSGYRVVCGDGAFGADGFVCLMSGATVIWFAFFDNSNPFISVQLDGNTIIARNNIDELWKIPINSPEGIAIEMIVPQ